MVASRLRSMVVERTAEGIACMTNQLSIIPKPLFIDSDVFLNLSYERERSCKKEHWADGSSSWVSISACEAQENIKPSR